MAKPKARKLKVFQTQLGFYDTVVATTSQTKALEIWGTHQNLFADGQARQTDDSEAVEAAMAHPDTLLRRAVGSTGRFELEPSSLPAIPDAPNPAKAKVASSKPKVPDAPLPDRSKLDAAEMRLKRVDEGRKAEEANLKRQLAKLDQTIADAQDAYVADRKSATAAVVEARKAYRAKGGQD